MKCIILLTLVALCYSYPSNTGLGYGSGLGSLYDSGNNFNVNTDGSITLTTRTGKKINIVKGPGSQNVVVSVTEPWFATSQSSQDDILAQILSNYQGDVSQTIYQQLMGEIQDAVQNGQISVDLYEALQIMGQGTNKWVNQVNYVNTPYLQKMQQQIQKQYQQVSPLYKTGIQHQSLYPIGSKNGQVFETVVVPVGVNQQGQVPESMQSIIGYTGSQGVFGTGKSSWNTLINYLNGNQQGGIQYGQYNKYGQSVVPTGPITGQLYGVVQKEMEVLNQQDQIQQEQLQQQQQQQQLLQQQVWQQMQQQQLQNQQQYVLQLQQQQQQEQKQVLEQQQQSSNVLNNLLAGTAYNMQNKVQQPGYWQQQPVYTQGNYFGGYGQGMNGYNTPLVV